MRTGHRALLCAVAAGVIVVSDARVVRIYAQGSPTQTSQAKFSHGQNVVPYYEGWIPNPDGSFDLVFGYFNRNYEEEVVIPAGPNNLVEPEGPDRGQPTYFLPRQNQRMFRLRVPKDFGQKAVTWTLTVHGRTDKVIAELVPAYEINEYIMSSGGNSVPFGEVDENRPPTIAVAPVASAQAGVPVTLTARFADDGLPKPRPERVQTAAPEQPAAAGTTRAQVNSSSRRARRGPGVTWLQLRGPAKAVFENTAPLPVQNGQAVTAVRFSQPGVYQLRATATDGRLSARTDVTVTVTGSADRPGAGTSEPK
jgi:hypothetical protein